MRCVGGHYVEVRDEVCWGHSVEVGDEVCWGSFCGGGG